MKYFITLSDIAEIDLAETNQYYSEISTDLLDRFWDDLTQTMVKLEESPMQFQEGISTPGLHFLKNFLSVFILRYVATNWKSLGSYILKESSKLKNHTLAAQFLIQSDE